LRPNEEQPVHQIEYASPEQQSPREHSVMYALGWLCLLTGMCMITVAAAFLYLTVGSKDVPPYATWLFIGGGLMCVVSLFLSRKARR
jgi:hypothetical protein